MEIMKQLEEKSNRKRKRNDTEKFYAVTVKEENKERTLKKRVTVCRVDITLKDIHGYI